MRGTYLDDFLTIREKIMLILLESKQPLSVEDITRYLGLPRRDYKLIYEALEHIAKSIRKRTNGKMELVMFPPQCKKCGYVFKELKKLRRPSRCPRCKSERISPARFMVIEKK